MNAIRAVLREMVGLFVEDESLTVLILVVVAGAAAAAFLFQAGPVLVGGLLVFGSLAALAVSALRGAR
jgi:hypothetical protein